MIRWERHHIVPKHAGGTDEQSNILICNKAMHAFMHEQRYKEFGEKYDYVAWKALSGQIPYQEATRLANQEYWRNPENRKRASERVSGSNNPMYGQKLSDEQRAACARPGSQNGMYGKTHSSEARDKIRNAKLGHTPWNKGVKRKQLTCPHCNKVGGDGMMQRWHFNNCKELNND